MAGGRYSEQKGPPGEKDRVPRLHPAILAGVPASRQKQFNGQIEEAKSKSEIGVRPLRIMSAIFFACEQAGAKVSGNEDAANITIDDQTLRCRVRERLRQVRTPLSEAERARGYGKYHVRLEATGRLIFEIETYLRGAKQIWEDEDGKPIEDVVPDILDGLLKGAQVRQAWDDEDRQRQEAEQQRLREAEERRKAAAIENARIETLLKLADDCDRAKRLKVLIDTLKLQGISDRTVDGKPVSEWIEWAEQVLEEHDPMRWGGFRFIRENTSIRYLVAVCQPRPCGRGFSFHRQTLARSALNVGRSRPDHPCHRLN